MDNVWGWGWGGGICQELPLAEKVKGDGNDFYRTIFGVFFLCDSFLIPPPLVVYEQCAIEAC